MWVKPKALWKMAVDLAMTVLLFCLMAYLLVGETAHEWLGVAMFGLFLLHHGLNGHWQHNLTKGRYTPMRVFQTVVDVLILLAMAGLMVSGVILSRVVFSFLPISGGMGFARTLHMLASYWGFLFISLHLGLHWGVVMGVMRKAANKKAPSAARTWLLRAAAALLAGFGAYAFFKHNIASYLLLRTHFVFFDVEQPLGLFFLEYLGMMALWAEIAYFAGKLLGRYGKRPGKK